jgi:hypothetical protein
LEKPLMADVFRWTGHFPERTRSLMRYLAQRADALGQVYPRKAETEAVVSVTILVTSLAMNYVHRGSYFPETQTGPLESLTEDKGATTSKAIKQPAAEADAAEPAKSRQ